VICRMKRQGNSDSLSFSRQGWDRQISFPSCSRRILRRKSTVSSWPFLWSYSTKWVLMFGTGSMGVNEEARRNTAGYWCCSKKGVKAVESDDDNSWENSLESDDDAGYWSSTSGVSGVSNASSATDRNFLEPFDIMAGAGKNEYDEGDDQSVGAWSTVTKGNDATSPGPEKVSGAPAHSTASVDTSSPEESADSDVAQEALLTRMRSDPIYVEELMRQFMASKNTTPPTPQTTTPVFPPHHLAFGESMLRQLSSLATPQVSSPPAAKIPLAPTPLFAAAAPPPAFTTHPAVPDKSPPTKVGEGPET
jgi:hypothetical protein